MISKAKSCAARVLKIPGKRAQLKIAFSFARVTLRRSNFLKFTLNSELTKKALEKVGNPNVLINLVSRRVRQLNSGSGALSRPLLSDVGNLSLSDIALAEIIEDKIGFDMPELVELVRPTAKKKKKA